MKKGVIVIGGHVQGLGIVRILGKEGIPSIVIDETKNNIARHSKYCNEFFRVENSELLHFLLELGKNKKYTDWLIFPTNDAHVEILSKNKTELNGYFKISTDDWHVIEKCYNKKITYTLAVEAGLNIANTFYPANIEELIDIEKKIKFPCIIKPAIMHTFYRQLKKKVLVCKDYDELKLNYELACKIIPAEEIIVQEIIQGSNENNYSACFFYNRSKPIVSLVAQRKRQHPLDFGNATTYALTVRIKELEETAKVILNKIRYWGLCEVEFKKDERDGQFKFLEINPRTWKWHSIANKSHSPFLLSLYNFIYEGKVIENNEWRDAGWKHITTDIPIILKLLILGRFKKGAQTNVEQAVFSFSDLKPFLYEMIYLPYLITNR